MLLQIAGNGGHGGEIVRDIRFQFREGLFNIADKSGAAGAGQKALFHQLTAFGIRHHIGAERRFRHRVKPQPMQPGDNLPQLGVGELAGDGGGNDRIDMVFLIVPALFYHINDIEDIGFIGDGAKGALIDAGTAGNAGIVINSGGLILIHGDGLDLAGVLAGTLAVYNGGIRADPGTGTAVHTLGLIDVRHMVVEGDGSLGAGILAPAG